jgi:hypothetical protein
VSDYEFNAQQRPDVEHGEQLRGLSFRLILQELRVVTTVREHAESGNRGLFGAGGETGEPAFRLSTGFSSVHRFSSATTVALPLWREITEELI